MAHIGDTSVVAVWHPGPHGVRHRRIEGETALASGSHRGESRIGLEETVSLARTVLPIGMAVTARRVGLCQPGRTA